MRHRFVNIVPLLSILLLGSVCGITEAKGKITHAHQLLLNATEAAVWNNDRYQSNTMLRLAELYLLAGDNKNSEKWLRNALSSTDSSIDHKLRAKTFSGAAELYFRLGEKNSADFLLKRSLDEAKLIYDDSSKQWAYWDIARAFAKIGQSPDLLISAISNNNSPLRVQSQAFDTAADQYFREGRHSDGNRIVDSWLRHISGADQKTRVKYTLDVAESLARKEGDYARAYSLLSSINSEERNLHAGIALKSLARETLSNNNTSIATKALMALERSLEREKVLPTYLDYAEIAYLHAKAGNSSRAQKLARSVEHYLKRLKKQNIAPSSLGAQAYQWLANTYQILGMQKKSWGYTSSAQMTLDTISDRKKKDKAIASVARVRANISGDAAQVAEMIDQISDTKIRDNALSTISRTLARANLLTEAEMLIDKIQSQKEQERELESLAGFYYINTIDYVVEKGRDHLAPRLLSKAVVLTNNLRNDKTRSSKLITIARKAQSTGNEELATEIIEDVISIVKTELNSYHTTSRLTMISKAVLETGAQLSDRSVQLLEPLARLHSLITNEALEHHKKGDIEKAKELLFVAANSGDRRAQYAIAHAYSTGDLGLKPNAKELRSWTEKSADNGYSMALYTMWRLNVARDDKLASDYLWRAAEQGHDHSQYTLTAMATEKSDTISDSVLNKAIEWASENNAQLQTWLGIIYYQGKKANKDHKAAGRWFKKAAYAGNPDGQASYGVMLYVGHGVKKDVNRGRYWLDLAAKKNNKTALTFLASISKPSSSE